jgi:iron(III) transport system ATP-binding protein
MDEILKIEQLSKFFKKDEYVLNDINLSLKKGEIVAIVGESGSGKTTLTRLISGLETPNSGLIKVNNTIVNSDSIFIAPEKRNIGMVFQDYALFPHLTVGKNIAYGLSKFEDKEQRILEVLALVNMTTYINRYPHQLSGGQQQRVALARALAPKPEILILDEPFSNLDVMLRIQLRDEIFDIIRKANVTAIFVTHDTQDAIAISDKIIILQNGNIVQKGTTELLYKNPINNYVASLFGEIINLSTEDLSYFGFKGSESEKYAVRINQFIVNEKSDYQLNIEVDKSIFIGEYYLNTVKLPNGRFLNFHTKNNKSNSTVDLGFNSDMLLSFS